MRLHQDELSSLSWKGVDVNVCLWKHPDTIHHHIHLMILTKLTCLLTLCTALPFVANRAHAVSISAGPMAAAKRVYALGDRDITLGSFPAAVTNTGALVVLAIAAAQHRACSWGRTEIEKGRKEKKKKQLADFSKIFKAATSCSAQPDASTPPMQEVE